MVVPMPSREPDSEVFDFETSELVNFEVWDRVTQAPAGQGKPAAFVSLQVSGNVGLNRWAREMLGETDAVKIAFDPKNKRLALIPTDVEDEGGFKLSASGAQLACGKVLEHYGIRVTKTRRCRDLKMVDGILVVDL